MAERRAGAALVAAGILLSRLAGLVRERVFAHYFGSSVAAGAFRAALRIPNLLQNLFGEGVLSASFIPVYARLRAEGDEQTASRVASIVGSLLALSMAVLVALGVVATPWMVDVIAPGFSGEARVLTTELVRILFPGIGLLVMSAWCLGILNSHRKFFLSYAAPVAWNAAMIAALVWFGRQRAGGELAVALAWGTVAGCGLQFVVQVPTTLRLARGMRPELDLALAPVRDVLRNLGPVVASRGVVQLSAYLDSFLASFLGAGAVATLGYAQTIALLPVSLFGMSVAAAELPTMSSVTGTGEEIAAAIGERVTVGQRQVTFFVVPSGIAFLAVGDAIVTLLYRGGRFTEGDGRAVWLVLAGSAVGLLATTTSRLYASAFYALRDTRTPLRFAAVRVALTAGLGALAAFPLRPALAALLARAHLGIPTDDATVGALGLTASAGMSGWVELALLRRALDGRLARRTSLPISMHARTLLAAVLAAVVARVTLHYLPPGNVWVVAGVGAVTFGIAYLAIATAIGLDGVRRMLDKRRQQ